MSETENDYWNPSSYDNKMGFVSKLGTSIIPLLDPLPGERILDLGCGTGDLTAAIARSGAACTGIDASPSMIAEARAKHPGIAFKTADARDYDARAPFDAVFSNAALHWIRPPERAAAAMRRALRPGGRVAAEFGGKGNVAAVVRAITAVLREQGVSAEVPWYFPSVAQYASLLEQHGFEVRYAELYDRPTKLGDGEEGLFNWLEAFAFPFFKGWTETAKRRAFEAIARAAEPDLYRGGEWIVDYRRLRILAVVPF